MTTINRLTVVDQASDGDIYPISQAGSDRPRGIEFSTMKAAINAEVNAAVEEAVEASERAEEAAASADANVLRADLATEGDPLKGAELVGYESGTVADKLNDLQNQTDPAKGAAIVGYSGSDAKEALDRTLTDKAVSELAAETTPWDEGSVVYAGNYRYIVQPAASSDFDLTSAGGKKLKLLPDPDGGVRLSGLQPTFSPAGAATLITNGRATNLDIDFIDATTTRLFSAPTTTRDYANFRVNGAYISGGVTPGALASVPAAFPVRPLFSAMLVAPGTVEVFGFDVADIYDPRIAFAGDCKEYYVDPVNGTAGGVGTEADPMDRPSRVTAAEGSSPSAESAFVIICKQGKYDQSGVPWAFPAGLVKPYGIVPWGVGRVKLLQGYWANSRTWVDEGGGVWSSAVTFVTSVFDELIRNDLGDPSFYSPVAGVPSLTPGTWVQVGGTVYIYTLDGRQPDVNIGMGRQLQSNIADGLGSISVYAENCDFLGGQTGTRMRTASTAYDIDFVTKNCRWAYSSGNGMELYGHRLAIHQGGVSCYNLLDGFNYHSDSGTLTRESLGVEINCRSYRNGYSWSSSTNINNGSTAHDRCVMLRYGTVAFENQGPNIVDVNDIKSYCFGCVARDSLRSVGPDKADYDFSSFGGSIGAEVWLDNCTASAGGSLYAITAGCPVNIRWADMYPAIYGVGNVAPY